MSEKLTAYEIVFVNFNWKGNLDGVSTHNFLPESQVKYILFDRHQSQIQALEEKLRIAELKLSKFKVWGTDGCKSCEGGRITMFVANQECIQCNPQSYEALAAIKEKK